MTQVYKLLSIFVLQEKDLHGYCVVSFTCARFFSELCRINEHQKVALDLDPYVKKLLNARRRVVLVNNILQNAQVMSTAGTNALYVKHLQVIQCT